MKFLDATVAPPRGARAWGRLLRLPLLLAAVVAAAAAWWGQAAPAVLFLASGAFLGAGLSALGIGVWRSPLAYAVIFCAVAVVLVLGLWWLAP